MGLLDKFLNLNQKKWLAFIQNEDLTKDEEEIFRMFYLADNIDMKKFIENGDANSMVDNIYNLDDWEMINSHSVDPNVKNFKIKCSPTLRSLLNSHEPVPRGFPEWFYIVYPDVTVWIQENSKQIGEEFKGREDEILTENGPNLTFFRMMINRYKRQKGKLECSV